MLGERNMIRDLTPEQKTEIIERLADLEHKQWMKWSKTIAKDLERFGGAVKVPLIDSDILEQIAKRLRRWSELWIPYEELSEEERELGREWARKILQLFEELNMEIVTRGYRKNDTTKEIHTTKLVRNNWSRRSSQSLTKI